MAILENTFATLMFLSARLHLNFPEGSAIEYLTTHIPSLSRFEKALLRINELIDGPIQMTVGADQTTDEAMSDYVVAVPNQAFAVTRVVYLIAGARQRGGGVDAARRNYVAARTLVEWLTDDFVLQQLDVLPEPQVVVDVDDAMTVHEE